MAFDLENFIPDSGGNTAPRIFRYRQGDTIAAMKADNYFDKASTDMGLKGGDFILIQGIGESSMIEMVGGGTELTVLREINFAPVGAPILRRSLTDLTQTNLENLAATPIELVAGEATKFHFVTGWRFRLIFEGTAFDDAAADGDLILKYAANATIDTMQSDGLIDAATTTHGISMNLTELIAAGSAIGNKALQLSNAGAEYTVVGGGDSTAQVEVFYYTLDTVPS